jgi:hypothetical protein
VQSCLFVFCLFFLPIYRLCFGLISSCVSTQKSILRGFSPHKLAHALTVKLCLFPGHARDCSLDLPSTCQYESLNSVVHVANDTCITVSRTQLGFRVLQAACFNKTSNLEVLSTQLDQVKAAQCFGIPLSANAQVRQVLLSLV